MKSELPEFLKKVIKKYPKVWKNYRDMGLAITRTKGIDAKNQQLVKLGIAIGAGLEGAVHSHVRRASRAGIGDEKIYHAALLAITTVGWPSAIRALSWIDDILKDIKGGGKG